MRHDQRGDDTNMRTFVFSAALVLAAAGAYSTVAQAQARDRCDDYANQMMSFDQRARQMRCGNWNSHSNYDGHYRWCQARPPGAAETALASWGTRFQTCQFAASGSPAARAQTGQPVAGGDPSRRPICTSFGNAAANWERRAASQGCNLHALRWQIWGNADRAITWCMGTSDADFRGRSPQALGHKGELERQCSAQLRRPIGL
jgi:hypothetical protein